MLCPRIDGRRCLSNTNRPKLKGLWRSVMPRSASRSNREPCSPLQTRSSAFQTFSEVGGSRRCPTNRSSCQAAHRAAGRGMLAATPSAAPSSPRSYHSWCGGSPSRRPAAELHPLGHGTAL